MAVLHPKMTYFLENLLPVYPEGYTPTVEELRARPVANPETVEAVHKVEDRTVPGPEGDIPLRIYTPEGEGPFPILVYYHGGGFVTGDLESHDAVCRSLSKASDHVVVAVDYRLAPEHPFPAGPHDCYAATKWVYDNANEVNGDATRLSVGGDSAGGNLAAVVALMARDKEDFPIAKQLLLYPTTDGFELGKYPSYDENGTGYFLTLESMHFFAQAYVQNPDFNKDPYAAPMNADDLSNLPPALIITAEFDPLRDEGEAYGDCLREAGVEVVTCREEGLIHGFFNLFSLMDAKEDISAIYAYIGDFLNEESLVI